VEHHLLVAHPSVGPGSGIAGSDLGRGAPLRGVGDRRALFADLVRTLSPDYPRTLLAIFALEGLGAYREHYGRPAVETLRVQLAARLASSLDRAGTCYQPRGDEFVALITTSLGELRLLLDRIVAALHQPDARATVSATFGAVLLPDEANDPATALSLADQHLFANSPWATSPTRTSREARRLRSTSFST